MSDKYSQQSRADKNMQLNKQILEDIKRQINSKSFHKTELYKLLRDELSGIGNWKAKPRGMPDINNIPYKQTNKQTNTRKNVIYFHGVTNIIFSRL